MAEIVTLVCDPCRVIDDTITPAVMRVSIKTAGNGSAKTYSQDLCEDHYRGMIEMSHPAKRGRPPKMGNGEATTPIRRRRTRKSTKSTETVSTNGEAPKKRRRRRKRAPVKQPAAIAAE